MNEQLVIRSFAAAVILSPVLVLTHIVLLRCVRAKPLVLLLGAFCVYTASWLVIFKLHIQPNGIYGLAVISAVSTMVFIFLGYMEFFSMVCRGFSLRIMVDIYRKGELTLEEIAREYGERGMEWMFSKRLETLINAGLIEVSETHLKLTGPKAKFLGIVGNTFKSFLNMGKGG